MDPNELFWELADELRAADPRVAELVDAGVGRSFAPLGNVFRDWLSVPHPDRDLWRSLLEEGTACVRE